MTKDFRFNGEEVDINGFRLSTYVWCDLSKADRMNTSLTYGTFKEVKEAIEDIKNMEFKRFTKIFIGGFDRRSRNYLYFDLQGNGHISKVDIEIH